jgi:nitrogen-specific signal transduction histidine kinase
MSKFGASVGWNSLVLPLGLFLISDFEKNQSFLFYSITLLHIIFVICTHFYGLKLNTRNSEKIKKHELIFYISRGMIFLCISFLTAASFYFDGVISAAGLISIAVLTAGVEVIVSTFHPNKVASYLYIMIVGFLPLGVISVVSENKNVSFAISITGFIYLITCFIKISRLNKKFIEDVEVRFQRDSNQKRLTDLIDAMPAKVVWIDENLNYLLINSQMASEFDKKVEDYKGQKVGFNNFELAKLLHLAVSKMNKNYESEIISLKSKINPNDENSHEHNIQIKKIKNVNGKSEFIVVAIDISEEVKMRNEIEEQKIKNERQSRLSSLGEVASGVAHEIKNPLAIITGSSFLIEKALHAQEVKKDDILLNIDKINKTVSRIVSIINSMSKLSRDGSSDKFEWHPSESLISEALVICKEKFRLAEVRFEVTNLVENYEVFCVPHQISQVVLNLLMNSYDALEKQQDKYIQIKLLKTDDSFKIQVIDNGPGVAHPNKLFNPFFTTKEPGKGTGLGLSICRKIMHSQKGQIQYLREKNQSIFVLNFELVNTRQIQKLAA